MPPPVMLRFLQQFASPLLYVLLFALAFDLYGWIADGAVGIPIESIAIAVILLINGALGAYQEHKADEALAKAKKLGANQSWVIRDGKMLQLPSAAVVPGDVLRIEAGDRIPVDAIVLKSNALSVDESMLTGESLPIDKEEGDEIPAGALAVRGVAYVEAMRTGASSAIGRMAETLSTVRQDATPLEKKLKSFAGLIALTIFGLAFALLIGGIYAEGWNRLHHVVMFSVALAVAAIPEGLPAILTVALAIGVQRMAQRKALVRKLNAVETLGSVTVIATDKTGTLTENRMMVQEIDSPDPERTFAAMVIANDSEEDAGAGDAVDLALLDFARKNGADTARIAREHRRTHSRPFDSAYKYMSVTVNDGQQDVTYLKGAPEVLLERSRMSKHEHYEWETKMHSIAGNGMRVLGVAWKQGGGDDNIQFLGLISIWDPPRPEVPAAIEAAQNAGIRVAMITGDHPDTASFIATQIGIDGGSVATGQEIMSSDDEELRAKLQNTSVFARVLPEHKLRLVEAFKAMGHVVAVTGDGVNDALAVKRADVGIAMGKRGSDVTREVADIVLLDDNFTSIVDAVAEGRSIYENIIKFVGFFLSTDLALALLVVGGLGASYFMGFRDVGGDILLPLTALQLLWINVIADGPVALALTFDRNPGLMRLPPRAPGSSLLSRELVAFVLISGLTKAAIGLMLFTLLPRYGYTVPEALAAVFLYEASAQLVFAYPVRHLHVEPMRNWWVHVSVAGGVALQIIMVSWLPAAKILGLKTLEVDQLIHVVVAVAMTWAIAEVIASVVRARNRVARSSLFHIGTRSQPT